MKELLGSIFSGVFTRAHGGGSKGDPGVCTSACSTARCSWQRRGTLGSLISSESPRFPLKGSFKGDTNIDIGT